MQVEENLSQDELDASSINNFLNSYQKLCKLDPQLLQNYFKLPNDNEFYIINAQIKSANFLTRIKTLQQNSSVPMFAYPEWNQLGLQVKKIFYQKLNIHVKHLNTGNLVALQPNKSLNIRTDYYCYFPHQVFTTFIALNKCEIGSGALAVSNDTFQFDSFQNESELLSSLQANKKQIKWNYADLKQGSLLIFCRSTLYGSFRNDSNQTKYYAQMRWIKKQNGSSSSNSS